jgi:UDP-N-acetylglucosamine 2-epimerase
MPEEINRVLTDHIAKLRFCPTKIAVDNLAAEGIRQGVYEVGDVMYDSVVFYREKARSIESDLLAGLDIEHKSYYLATVHRAENTGDAQHLDNILKGLGEISSAEHPTLLPLHPRTKKTIVELGLTTPENIRIVEPVSYIQMIALENNAKAILTDSGGIQKEAYMLGVPCITLRDETEWIETVESGWNILAGSDRAKIIEAVERADELHRAKRKLFYGDGQASDKIYDIISRGEQ